MPLHKFYSCPFNALRNEVVIDVINETLNSIECLTSIFDKCCGRWRCSYGTVPIRLTIPHEYRNIYDMKIAAFQSSPSFTKKRHINFDVVHLTRCMSVPFNWFLKQGITTNLIYVKRDCVHSIHFAAKKRANKIFELMTIRQDILVNQYDPNLTFSSTNWLDYADEDFDDLRLGFSKKEWSASEIILRKKDDRLQLYFNRQIGDRCSASYIFIKLREALEGLNEQQFLWRLRQNYLMFKEGVEEHIDTKGVEEESGISKYILNDMISRELLSFLC
jgi:hypothetical protein